MKRRLSIAISLVSDPNIVFLDEPTTGLDPEARRHLWNILQEVKQSTKRAMVLTTHSMEEADVLCNRISIINHGVLKCIGTQARLKQLYGGGFTLFINLQKNATNQAIQKVIAFVQDNLPHSFLMRSFNKRLLFKVPTQRFHAETFFGNIEKAKYKLLITDWGINQSSLEDVFRQICEIE